MLGRTLRVLLLLTFEHLESLNGIDAGASETFSLQLKQSLLCRIHVTVLSMPIEKVFLVDLPHNFVMILHLIIVNALCMLLPRDLLGDLGEESALLCDLIAVLII